MLIKTNIFNRNFYPIKVYKLEETILRSDKINVSSDMYINDTTFNNHVGTLIKPFQDVSQMTSIALQENKTDFLGTIYLDSTIYTDSIDYGTFGVLTGQKVNIKHKFVTVKFNNDYQGGITKKIIDDMDENSLIHIKFSMKDIEDWDAIYNQLKLAGFSDYIIEKFDFFDDGIYATGIAPPPVEGCTNPLKRDSICIKNDTIKTLTENLPGNKFSVWKDKDNIQFELLLKKSALSQLYSTLSGAFKDSIDAIAETGKFNLPLYQWPIGMSVILQMKTAGGATPYKLNLKITTPIMFFLDVEEEEKEKIAGTPVAKKLNNLIISPENNQDINTLLCLPEESIILTNPNSIFNAHIKLVPFSLQQLWFSKIPAKDSFYEITNVYWDITDSNVTSSKIDFITDVFPSKKIIPQDININSNNRFDIFIDTTGITSDYTNTINVDYIYDGTNFTLQTDVIVKPILPVGKPVIEHVNNSIFFENSTKYHPVIPALIPVIYDTYYFNVLNSDTLHFNLINNGEADTTISNVELENPYIQFQELNSKQNKTAEDVDNLAILQACIDKYESSAISTNGIYNYNVIDSTEVIALYEKRPLSTFLTYNVDNINCPASNLLGLEKISVSLNMTFFKQSTNYINGIPMIIKVVYGVPGSSTQYTKYIQNDIQFNIDLILGEMSLMYDKELENIKYIRPATLNTLFIGLYKKFSFNKMQNFLNPSHSFGINVIGGNYVNYENSDSYSLIDEDINIDRSQFPLSIPTLSSSEFYGVNYDISFNQEGLYKYKIRLYTNYQQLPYIDIPMITMSTNLDIEEALQFDSNNFYVRNNKYFVSLVKLQSKDRTITIKNTSSVDIEISEISYFNVVDKFGTSNIDITQQNSIILPYTLTSKNSLKLDLRLLGKDFGHFNSFIILKTPFGDAYLQLATFVNTKYKDVYVLMENAKGTNFVSALNGADVDYIKLTNFGDNESLLQITKLGYNQDDFLIENIEKLYPNTVNYIENIFVPTSTGKKIGQIDFKIRDMLETYRLIDTDDKYVFKIQNSHILAEMVGIALTEHALPHFSKSVVDFGYISYDKRATSKRIDTFTIKNYGLTPFVITNITKTNPDSPFTIPLIGIKLPIKVDKEITLPIYINNANLIDNQKVYMDVFKFEIQDLKSKKMFNHEIITKVELSENNREYVSFNSEFIEFGYCEINNFKVDDLTIKNFSTDKISVAISYDGDAELQTLDNFALNLQPNQQFNVPVYFYPHGIDTFNGTLTLNFNNGNYIKEIDLFGWGVDFKSPKITIENKMASYYKSLKNYLGKQKYI